MHLSEKNGKMLLKLLKRIAVGAGVVALLAGIAAVAIWVDSRSVNPRTSLGNLLRKRNGEVRQKSVKEMWQRHDELQREIEKRIIRIKGTSIPEDRRREMSGSMSREE